MLRLMISGVLGKMGQEVAALAAAAPGMTVAGGIDPRAAGHAAAFPLFAAPEAVDVPADVAVDFSHTAALPALLAWATQRQMPLVLATTGYADEDKRFIAQAAAQIPIFQSANMSYGINLLCELAHTAAAALGDGFDVEIIEKHHNRKLDAPSGTALALADAVREGAPTPKALMLDRCAGRHARTPQEIGIASIRGGTVPGEHEVGFYGDDEIISLHHTAQSRRIFATGALRAARYIAGKAPGLYSMQQLLLEQSLVTHVSVTREVAILTIHGVPATAQGTATLFRGIRDINIDMISQTAPTDGHVDVSFSLPHDALERAITALSAIAHPVSNAARVVKLTVEGPGMVHAAGVASRVFDCLAAQAVCPRLITTSETKISLCVAPEQEARAVAAIRAEFGL